MNASTFITASVLALVSLQAATAGEIDTAPQPRSTLTRAEVQADLARARAEGRILVGEDHAAVQAQPSTQRRTRAEVRDETLAAVRRK